MNDVLPKPFTKEGLLNMLEKHLGHLKKQPPGMEAMVAPPPSNMSSAKRSLKSEDSPVTSPATNSNWNSPGGQHTGVSPAGSTVQEDPYMQAVHNNAGPAPFGVQAPIQPQPMYQTSPSGPMAAPPRQPNGPIQAQHRRGISDISGGAADVGGNAKRQQMYPPGPQLVPAHGNPQFQPQIPRPPGR